MEASERARGATWSVERGAAVAGEAEPAWRLLMQDQYPFTNLIFVYHIYIYFHGSFKLSNSNIIAMPKPM